MAKKKVKEVKKKSGWKEWPYWLKGGVIITIIGLILFFVGILFIYLDLFFNPCHGDVCASGFLTSIGILFFSVFAWPMMLAQNQDILIWTLIISILQLFIIGAIIGFIYGKIKSRGGIK